MAKTIKSKRPELNIKNKIKKTTTLGEVITKYPNSADILLKYGLHCIGCHVATWETLEQGAVAHRIGDKKFDKMLKELNNLKEVKNERDN